MKLFLLVACWTVLNVLVAARMNESVYEIDPDVSRNVSELISSKGYPVEDHSVQTDDGFILSVQHIPHGKNNQSRFNDQQRPVVLMVHGLLAASSDWVINFPHQSLGFLLADAGYNVWLGNSRGNKYSRRHIKYKPSMKEFWDFSFDEMAEYDLPAMIDYILNVTHQKQLFYVGHSQGTTQAFALLSENPEYNKKIKLFVALAPVGTVGYITNAIHYLAPFTVDIQFLLKLLGVNEFLPGDVIMTYLTELLCDSPDEKALCENVMFLFFGNDLKQLNQTRLSVYTAHAPAGSSSKSVVHYAQMVNSKAFIKYDYGRKGNLIHYGQTLPPEYDVSLITAPVATFWALNDGLADPVDVALLQKKLNTLVSSTCVSFPEFDHYDFIIAEDANRLIYDKVLQLLAKYSQS